MKTETLNPMANAIMLVTGVESNPLATLDALLDKFVDNASSTGDVIIEFSTELCRVFDKDGTKWFDLKGKNARPVNEYRNKFIEKFSSIKKKDGSRKFQDGTINSYWHRVKIESGKVVQARVQSDVINVRRLTLEDLMTMIRRTEKAESDTNSKYIDFTLVSDELDMLKDMFVRLGGHIDEKDNLSIPF
jgi:hypothetical protein